MTNFEFNIFVPERFYEKTVMAPDRESAAKALLEGLKGTGHNIDSCGDTDVIGLCEGCLKVLFEDEKYEAASDEDGTLYFCPSCS